MFSNKEIELREQKSNESEEEQCNSEIKIKKAIKPSRSLFPVHKEHSADSLRKVESEKITQNMFQEEGGCEAVRLPLSESSDQLSMQVEEE